MPCAAKRWHPFWKNGRKIKYSIMLRKLWQITLGWHLGENLRNPLSCMRLRQSRLRFLLFAGLWAKRQARVAHRRIAMFSAAFFLLGALGFSSDAPATRLVLLRSLSHNNAVYWAAFSKDGKILATASLDNTVKRWNVADGKHVGTLKGHGDGVAFVGFLPDGTMATASLDRSLKLWSADGKATQTFTGHQDYLSCAALSNSGMLLVSGGFDKTVRLWSTKSGAVATFTGHTGNVQSVAISANEKIVASGSDDR